MTRRFSLSEAAFPAGLAALGLFVILDARRIVDPASSNTVGPRAFPYAVGVLLLASAVVVLVNLARGRHGHAEEGEDVDLSAGTDWLTVGELTVVFAAFVVLLEPLGWPIAATVLFAGAAWTLGARPVWRPVVIGALLAVLTYLLFVRFLGLYLPAGPLEGVLGG